MVIAKARKASYFLKPRTPAPLEENKLRAQQGACQQLRSLVFFQSTNSRWRGAPQREGCYFLFKGDLAEFLGAEKGLQKSLAVGKFCSFRCEKRMSYRNLKLIVATMLS